MSLRMTTTIEGTRPGAAQPSVKPWLGLRNGRPHYPRTMDPRDASNSRAARRMVIRRLALSGAVLGLILAVLALTGSFPTPDEARDWGDGLGDFAYVAFVPLFVLVNFVITWPILAGAAGLLFGTAV